MYASGELKSQRDVVEFIGCHPSTVRNRSQKEGWGKERQKLVQRLAEQGESVAGLLRVHPTEQESSSLASTRATLCAQVLNLSSALLQHSAQLTHLLDRTLDQEPGRVEAGHAADLLRCHASVLDQLLRLSGLSGSSPVKPSPAPAPVPPSVQRPGRDTSWAEPV